MKIDVQPSDIALTTTLADLVGSPGFFIKAGRTYAFRYRLDVSVAASTDGVLFHPDGPALTRLSYNVQTPSSATATTLSNGNDLWKGAATTTTPPTTAPASLDFIVIVEGIVTPSASGSVSMWGVVEAAGVATLKAGSFVEYALVK